MSYTFNLLDEPWLSVRLADGQVIELGLLDVFTRSGEIVALAETAPPNLVAQYRLLLAIVHRALTLELGQWKTKDRARWYRDGLPVAAIHAYLEQWRERFWLFHPQYPFMQVVALKNCAETQALYPSSTVSLEQFYGTAMFNQEVFQATSWTPQKTVCALLGYLQFVPGGFFPGKKFKSSEKAGALVNTAAVIPIGQTLAQTLVLALHPASSRNTEHDLPAWEREPLTLAQLRGAPVLATGANDRYTRQSRAVLFLPEEDGSIRWLRFAAGWALGEDPNAPDPMASFRAGSNGPVRLTFTEERALWRDLPALVPNPGKQSLPPAVLSHAIDLHQEISDDRVYQPLLVAGIASDQAKLLRWRAEQISLPVSLLEDADRAAYLRIMVERAETLFKDMNGLAVSMLAASMPEPNHKDTRSRARSVLEAGPLTSSYFTAAEQTLPEILLQLAEGHFEEADRCWNTALRRSARLAWERVTQGLGYSARALRADAKFLPRFYGLLNKQVPETHTAILEKETAE